MIYAILSVLFLSLLALAYKAGARQGVEGYRRRATLTLRVFCQGDYDEDGKLFTSDRQVVVRLADGDLPQAFMLWPRARPHTVTIHLTNHDEKRGYWQ